MSAAVFEYFATSSIAIVRPRIPAPEPPYSSGMHRPGEAGVDEQVEEVLGVLVGVVDLAGPGRDLLLGELADGGLELGELGREVELHERRSLRAAARDGSEPRATRGQALVRRSCGAGG